MADLTVVATAVLKNTGAIIEWGVAAVAIAAGQVVYKDDATSQLGLCDTNSGTSGVRVAFGIALNSAGAGQPVQVHRKGPITLGAILTTGGVYVTSATPGAIAPVADLATGHYTTTLGIATSGTVLEVQIQNSGAVRP